MKGKEESLFAGNGNRRAADIMSSQLSTSITFTTCLPTFSQLSFLFFCLTSSIQISEQNMSSP